MSSISDSSSSSDDDIMDTRFSEMMSNWKEDQKKKKEVIKESPSKERKVQDFETVNTHYDTNKPTVSRSTIFEGLMIYDKFRFDVENEKLRLEQIVTNETGLVWADVRHLLQSSTRHRPLWWPGRLLTNAEINLLDTSDYNANQIRNRQFRFVELFGYRNNDQYHPILLSNHYIQSICKPDISVFGEEIFADPQMRKEKWLHDQFKEAMDIYSFIVSQKKLDITKSTPLEEFESALSSSLYLSDDEQTENETKNDTEYKQLMKKNTVSITEHQEKEKLHAGDLIAYYYKPYGPAGDKKALFQTRIVKIHSVKNDLKLVLENGHVLVEDTQLRRVEDSEFHPVENDGYYGCFKCLEEYTLVVGDISKQVDKYQLYTFNELKQHLEDLRMDYTKQLEALDGQRRIDTLFYDKEKNNSCQISKLIKKKDMEKMSNPFDSDLSSD